MFNYSKIYKVTFLNVHEFSIPKPSESYLNNTVMNQVFIPETAIDKLMTHTKISTIKSPHLKILFIFIP